MLLSELIAGHRRGELDNAAARDLADLIRAVKATHQGGSITITLGIKPDKHSSTEVEVTAKVSVKVPKRPIKPATLFINDKNELTRTDPDQLDAFPETEEDVDPSTGEVTERPRLVAVRAAPRDGTDG